MIYIAYNKWISFLNWCNENKRISVSKRSSRSWPSLHSRDKQHNHNMGEVSRMMCNRSYPLRVCVAVFCSGSQCECLHQATAEAWEQEAEAKTIFHSCYRITQAGSHWYYGSASFSLYIPPAVFLYIKLNGPHQAPQAVDCPSLFYVFGLFVYHSASVTFPLNSNYIGIQVWVPSSSSSVHVEISLATCSLFFFAVKWLCCIALWKLWFIFW